jgi:hypothetical protein
VADGRTREAYEGLLKLFSGPQDSGTIDLLLGVYTRLLAQLLRDESRALQLMGMDEPGPLWASALLDERARRVMDRGARAAMLDP